MIEVTLATDKSVIFITGCAGFIGGALALNLIETTSAQVVGLDNMNEYYDVKLKEYRLNRIYEKDSEKRFVFIKADISDKQNLISVFEKYKPDMVIHLAAQAGVRYSIENPDVYIQSNIIGFYNLLEACRYNKEKLNIPIKHFLYASSSSVYGDSKDIPYSEEVNTDHPASFYAATKKADEVMAYSYAKLYGIPMTGMRFFTVYGPAGRPDMAYYKFTNKLRNSEKLQLYNEGKNKRDFTYIDDVVKVIKRIIISPPESHDRGLRYAIYNIGNKHPVDTITFLRKLETALKSNGLIPKDTRIDQMIEYCGAVSGDVEITFADMTRLENDMAIALSVDIDEGLNEFAKWYAGYKIHSTW